MRARTVLLLVASFAVALGCIVGLGELLSVVELPRGATGFDSSITTWVVAHRTGALTAIAKALSVVGSQKVLAPVVALVALTLLWRRSLEPAVLLVVIWGGALALYSLAKALVDRPRPPERLHLVRAAGSSFPSGHATQSLATFVALALVAGTVSPRAARAAVPVAVVLAAAIAASRVYLGVHWTTDVLAGLLAGAAWTVAATWLLRRRSVPAGSE